MNQRKLEQILAASQKSIEREAKQKAREDWLNEPVTCALCQQTVPRKATAKVPGLGPACKRHPGVS